MSAIISKATKRGRIDSTSRSWWKKEGKIISSSGDLACHVILDVHLSLVLLLQFKATLDAAPRLQENLPLRVICQVVDEQASCVHTQVQQAFGKHLKDEELQYIQGIKPLRQHYFHYMMCVLYINTWNPCLSQA